MAADTLINDFELPFQLYDVLDSEKLTEHAKFSEHNRETFDAVLDTGAISEDIDKGFTDNFTLRLWIRLASECR